MQIEHIAYLTHLVCPALNYVLTLTISLHYYSKFKVTWNLCQTKARIVQITPFSSLTQVPCIFQSRLYGWIITISMTYLPRRCRSCSLSSSAQRLAVK
jgi:hypothetical protein